MYNVGFVTEMETKSTVISFGVSSTLSTPHETNITYYDVYQEEGGGEERAWRE